MKTINILSLAGFLCKGAYGQNYINLKPEVTIDEQAGKIWQISGMVNGDYKFACVFQYENNADTSSSSNDWVNEDLTVTVRARGKRGHKCGFNLKWRIKPSSSYSGGYGYRRSKPVTFYKMATVNRHFSRIFGVSGVDDLVSVPQDWTRKIHIINEAGGSLLKLDYINENGEKEDMTGDLNDFGDAYHCTDKFTHLVYGEDGDKTCEQNNCLCPGGTPKPRCDANNRVSCRYCDDGYDYKSERGGGYCQFRECQCHASFDDSYFKRSLGVGATGVDCRRNGSSDCASCSEDLTFSINHNGVGKCDGKFCYCNNGNAVPNNSAECNAVAGNNGKHEQQCADCNPGYYLGRNGESPIYYGWDNWVCKSNQCTCSHGKATTNTDCPAHGAESCEWCYSGWTVGDDNACRVKTCHCPNGNGATGDDCIKEELHRCASCHDDDHSVGDSHWGAVSGYIEYHCVPAP